MPKGVMHLCVWVGVGAWLSWPKLDALFRSLDDNLSRLVLVLGNNQVNKLLFDECQVIKMEWIK